MEDFVTRMHAACRKSDFDEMRRIIQELVFIGACDRTLSKEIMGIDVPDVS